MKIVINNDFGGFAISKKCAEWMAERGHAGAQKELARVAGTGKWHGYFDSDANDRTDPLLVLAVETIGKDANEGYSSLKVVEIPDGIAWEIDEYDGSESVHESHRYWA
jgi:hypothetical protein